MKTAEPLTTRYPILLRRGRALALAVELGITANCFRDMIENGNLQKLPLPGKRAWFRRDDIITLLS